MGNDNPTPNQYSNDPMQPRFEPQKQYGVYDTGQPQSNQQGQSKPPSKTKYKIIFVLLVLLLIGLVAGGIFAYTRFFKRPQVNFAKVQDTIATSLRDNGRLTKDDLAKAGADKIFFTSMYNMAQQSVHHLISESGGLKTQGGQTSGAIDLYDATFNYKSRQLNLTHQHKLNSTDKVLSFDRCVDGGQYSYYDISVRKNVTWEESSEKSYCEPTNIDTVLGITDGMNTGGLTNDQANTFVQALYAKSLEGLVRVDDASIQTRDNKEYIRLRAEIVPITEGGQVDEQGMGNFMTAFTQTSLDAAKHPYRTAGQVDSSMNITLYVDPIMLLPIYGEYLVSGAPQSEDSRDGAATKTDINYILQRVQYEFGGQVPRGAVDTAPEAISLAWPAEKRQ